MTQLTYIWKILPDTKERYGINEIGQIKNLKTNRILSQSVNSKGFLKSNTCVDYKHKTWVLHLWVAKFYVPNPRELKEISFKDGDKLNIFSDNLQWDYPHGKRYNAYYEYGNSMIEQNEKKRKAKKDGNT